LCLALSLPVAFFTGAALVHGDAASVQLQATGAAQTMIALLYVIGLMLALVIQESREQVAAMRRSETLFRAVVQDQTEMLMRWNPDGIRTFVNDAYCRAAGSGVETLLGSSLVAQFEQPDWAHLHTRILGLTPEPPTAVALQKGRAAPAGE